jgi:hypothetical protein
MADPIANFNFVEGVNLDDSQFTPTQITSAQELIRQYLEDRYQNLDFSPVSGLHDLVIRPAAQILLVSRYFIEEYNKGRTLYDALNKEGNEAIVDAILSNFLVSRRAGKKATGLVRVNVESYDINQYITVDKFFSTVAGLGFYPSSSFKATNEPGTNDVQIYSSGISNTGYFLVEVEAAENGDKYNISKDSQLSFSGSIDGFISAVAVNQFSGGANSETNKSVYNRIISSLSARNMTSPLAIDQAIRDNFPDTIYTSTHGVASRYMKRNSNNIFGIKAGCSCDVYVKNSAQPVHKSVSAIASKITEASDYGEEYVGNFVVTIKKNDFPGHYNVTSVKPLSDDKIIGSYPILKKKRVLVENLQRNSLELATDAAFSSYSSTEVIFSASAPGLSEIAVMCEVIGLNDIGKMQEFTNSGDNQSALIDTLIKACVPCFISVEPITVRISGDSVITAADISEVIASYILSIDSRRDKIRCDIIVSKILSLSGVLGVDLPVKINAVVLPPTEVVEQINLTTVSTLTIPSIPEKYVGPETVGFFVQPDSITINLVKIL